MSPAVRQHYQKQLEEIGAAGLLKRERLIFSPQNTHISVDQNRSVLNLCANNYLGLADDPRLIAAAKRAMDEWGFGMASVRFICGTQQIHRELELAISGFLQTDETILYSSCFDANGGLFETILSEADAVISDELNHASVIDGIRLCKAKRFRYRNNDMADLREKLREAGGARIRLIATDGVFSMDGVIANLPGICELAEEFGALVMVDDSHAVGFLGSGGRGTPELLGVGSRVDILTGTLGKAMGGASGGYTSGRKEIIDLLRQRSRPYLFSNSLAPAIVGATLEAIKLIERAGDLRGKLEENTRFFRAKMSEAGFDIRPGEHPIVPIMFGDAAKASAMAEAMLGRGVFVVAFSYPVVPMGKARIRCQMSAGHTRKDLELAVRHFVEARGELR
jgi:glycine C-acetyltransferase